MDEVANVHGYDGLVTHSTGPLYRVSVWNPCVSRAQQEHLAVSVTVNLHFLWILISPRAGKDPETMARRDTRSELSTVPDVRSCISQRTIWDNERGEGYILFIVRKLLLRRVKWLIVDEMNEREERVLWLNKPSVCVHLSWEMISIDRTFAPKTLLKSCCVMYKCIIRDRECLLRMITMGVAFAWIQMEKYNFIINRFNRFLNFSSHFDVATSLVSRREINFYVSYCTNWFKIIRLIEGN